MEASRALARRPATDPAVRGTMIGGSDAPKVAEVSRWGCALDVFLEKLGVVERSEDTEAAEWGTILEPVILRQYAIREQVQVATLEDRTGRPLIFTPAGTEHRPRRAQAEYLAYWLGTLRHPAHNFIGCHVDGWTLREDGAVAEPIEAKTASAFRTREWGQDDTDAMPDDYVVQCQHTSMVTGAILAATLEGAPPVVRGPVLIGGQRWKVQAVRPLAHLQVRLLEIELAFWDRVERRDPPLARADQVGRDALSLLYPKDTGEERVIPPGDPVNELVHELRLAKRTLKEAERDEMEAGNRVREVIGPLSAIVGSGWKVTWRRTRDGVEVDWQAAFKELAGVAALRGIEEARTIEQKYTKPKPGHRRLLPTFKDPED